MIYDCVRIGKKWNWIELNNTETTISVVALHNVSNQKAYTHSNKQFILVLFGLLLLYKAIATIRYCCVTFASSKSKTMAHFSGSLNLCNGFFRIDFNQFWELTKIQGLFPIERILFISNFKLIFKFGINAPVDIKKQHIETENKNNWVEYISID